MLRRVRTEDELLQLGRDWFRDHAEWPPQKEWKNTLGVTENCIRDRFGSAAAYIDRIDSERTVKAKPITIDPVPSGDVPVPELVDRLVADFSRLDKHKEASTWRRIYLPDNKPVAVGFMGDPHVDDPGTNWPLLKEHLEIFKTTPGLYGVNCGDATNNWVGALSRLYAYSRTTRHDAIRLAEWVISQVHWIAMVRGNHDSWSGSDDPLTWLQRLPAVNSEWEAQIELCWPNGWTRRVWIRHDFVGSSIYNKNHAMRRAALFTGAAHVYAAGHRHSAALQYDEDSFTGSCITLRASGYKKHDSHSVRLGHHSQTQGQTQTVIFDPGAQTMTAIPDLGVAAKFLTYLRGK